MSSSFQSGQNSRPTLPPIRDLFQAELSRHPTPHESPSITLARLRVSDDGDESLPYNDRTSKPLFQLPSRHSDPNLGPFRQHHVTSNDRANSSFFQARPEIGPPPFLHSGFSEFGARSEPVDQTHDRPILPRHRRTVPQPYDYRDSAGPHYAYNSITRHRSETALSKPSPRPWNISTSVHPSNMTEDERTPVARSAANVINTRSMNIPLSMNQQPQEENASNKYDCSYCGKIFNRPSSLKIHLNSHTGEKPFVCPVESCGRSFSVLSNMRRHTRVHQAVPSGEPDSDDTRPSSSILSRSDSFARVVLRRRGSTASTSSNSSYRSISSTDDGERGEKRFRPSVA